MLRLGRLCNKIESPVSAKMVAMVVVVQCQRWQVSSQVLRAIVIEVVVGGRQVGIERVDCANRSLGEYETLTRGQFETQRKQLQVSCTQYLSDNEGASEYGYMRRDYCGLGLGFNAMKQTGSR